MQYKETRRYKLSMQNLENLLKNCGLCRSTTTKSYSIYVFKSKSIERIVLTKAEAQEVFFQYKFKNVGKRFYLKAKLTCDSRKPIYEVICSICKEDYIGETGIGNYKVRDTARIYSQHIRQHEYEKVEKHVRICGKGNFTVFQFLQLSSNDTDL